MVFSSVEFLLYFLPVFLLLYAITPERYRNITLLVGSIYFYACGEPKYLPLLIVSVIVNFGIGRFLGAGPAYIERWNQKNTEISYEEWRKGVMLFAVTVNVGVLLLFKVAMRDSVLPLGVSFYTFQILSYLIDVYRRDIPCERSLVRMATYVAMFPQLVSGPIVNYSEVSNALVRRRLGMRNIQSGLKIFTLGLASKVLLADRIGLLWNDIQVRGFESISTPMAWLGALAYSFKLYFDFCGYSIMAIGLGVMLGFNFPENFHTPYIARSVREFYR
ncbi:MAG: MBOAT family protein, partial [Lachnospiraceae bacterium]|nr:MBOAT family protein [Lachnospiraceae bacterium]